MDNVLIFRSLALALLPFVIGFFIAIPTWKARWYYIAISVSMVILCFYLNVITDHMGFCGGTVMGFIVVWIPINLTGNAEINYERFNWSRNKDLMHKYHWSTK